MTDRPSLPARRPAPGEAGRLPDGAFICIRGQRPRIICDVCDKPVKRPGSIERWWPEPDRPWVSISIDLCARCKARRAENPDFREWADRIIAKHYPGADARKP
jgi:hypothetical protein